MADVRALPLAGDRHTSTETIAVHSPYDGSVLGEVPACTAADVDRAVASAKAALEAGPLPLWRRAAILDTAARLLTERREDFARIISAEAAKPIKTARVEAERATGTFQFAAAEARKLTGEMVPLDAGPPGEGKLGFTWRVPSGVVGAIAPFNFPLNLVVHKVAPAIAAGCPVVLKPASQTPFSSIALAELLIDECGLPADQLHVVTGGGSTVGNALVDHPDVALITFTGSPPVGWGIRARAPRKRVGLELGGTAPVIVHADADVAYAAERVAWGGFVQSGQTCISVQRVYVHEPVYDEFAERLLGHVRALRTGDPLDEETDVGPLIDAGAAERVEEWVEEAVAGGAEVLAGGAREGTLWQPTVLARVREEMRVSCREAFAPLVCLSSYDDPATAIERAAASEFGLQAGIFTNDLRLVEAAFDRIETGGLMVNDVSTFRIDHMPYGGVKSSGAGREGLRYAIEEMTELKLVAFNNRGGSSS
jgi:acyl-CoA reductase-like NAD-dependent aldehyde dehydrogenase